MVVGERFEDGSARQHKKKTQPQKPLKPPKRGETFEILPVPLSFGGLKSDEKQKSDDKQKGEGGVEEKGKDEQKAKPKPKPKKQAGSK